MLVTASVDAIQLSRRLAIEEDMTIQGQVVWTGSSSMDIRMELLQVCLSTLYAGYILQLTPKRPEPCMYMSGCTNQHICSVSFTHANAEVEIEKAF